MGGPVSRFYRSRHGMPFAAVVNQTRQGLGPASVFRARERGGHAWLADSPQSRTEPRWGTPPVSNLLGSHSRVHRDACGNRLGAGRLETDDYTQKVSEGCVTKLNEQPADPNS